jgi:hypothetical protein
MVTEHGRRELERSSSWTSVRSGLTLFVVTWVVSTVLSLGVQINAMRLDALARAGDPASQIVVGLSSALYQVAFSVVALLVVVATVKLTRAPPSSRAVTPALVAAGSWVLVLVLNSLLAVSRGAPQTGAGIDPQQLTILLAAARAVGVFALLFALARLARATDQERPPPVIGAALVLAAIDTGFPLWRAVTSHEPGSWQSASVRGALLAVQMLLAVLLLDLAVRSRRGVREVIAEEEPEPEPEPQSEPESESEPGSGPGVEREERLPDREGPLAEALVAAFLAAVGIALLPLWDAVSTTSSLRALTDAVSGVAPAERPLAPLLYGGLATAVGLALVRLVRTAPYFARLLWLGATLVSVHYVFTTAMEVASSRSSLVDGFVVCESGLDIRGNVVEPGSRYPGPYDGPRTASGEPCVRAGERRDVHAETEPRGGLQDGLVQIGARFPEERKRVIWGSLIALAALGVSGWLVARAGRDAPLPAPMELERPPTTRPRRRKKKRR